MKKPIIALVWILIGYMVVQGSTPNPPDTAYQLYLTQITAAEALLQLNKVSAASKLLSQCEVKYRGPEWKFLSAGLDQSAKSFSNPGIGAYAAIRLNPEGNLLAVACFDSTVLLIDWPSWSVHHVLKGHKAPVSTVGFSPDGKRLVSGGRDHSVIVWDVVTGREISRNDQAFSQGIYQARFSPDGSTIGVVSWERLKGDPPLMGFAKLMEGTDGATIKRFDTDPHPASGVVFTPDGKSILLSGWGEIVYSFDIETQKINWSYDLSDPADYNAFNSIDISSDGKTLAVGSADHRIHVLRVSDGKVLRIIESWEGHEKSVKAVAFSRDGRYLASAGEDQTILIWDTTGYKRILRLTGHTGTISGLDWSAEGGFLFSSSTDGTFRAWDIKQPFESGYRICSYGPWQTPVTTDGKYFAAPCSDPELVVYEASTGLPKVNLGPVKGLCGAISSDNLRLLSAGFDGTVRLWSLATGKEQTTFYGHTSRVDGVAILNKTGLCLSVGDYTMKVWTPGDTGATFSKTFGNAPFRIIVTPDESKILIGFNNGEVRVISPEGWTESAVFSCSAPLQEMTISPDGKLLAIFCGKNIDIRDPATGQLLQTLRGHELVGYGLGFSPDSRYLISGSYDQTFKFWDLATGECTLTWHGHDEIIYSCKFLSDSELLIGSPEGRIWYYRF